jgi:hypothetical protein
MKNKLIGPGSVRKRYGEIAIEKHIAQQRYGGWHEMGVNIDRFVVKVQ